jgi:hypothetical protein
MSEFKWVMETWVTETPAKKLKTSVTAVYDQIPAEHQVD